MAEPYRRYVLAPGLLEVRSNVRNITGFWSPLYSLPDAGPAKVSVTFEVTSRLAGPSRATPFGHLWGEPEADDVHYATPLLGPLAARLRLQGLRCSPQVSVNRTYHRLVRLRLGNVQSAGRQLADVVAVKLLQNHYTLVHAAALSFNGQGVLLVAPPAAGKSLTSLRALERGFSFLAEDIAITDGERVYGLPLTASFAWDIGQPAPGLLRWPGRLRIRAFQWMAAALPPLSQLLPAPALTISNFAPHTHIESQVPLAYVFILARGARQLVPLDRREALAKLLLINRGEFTYYQSQLLLGYSYFNPWLNLSDLMKREEELLARAVTNAACFLCQGPEPGAFIEQIEPIVR